MIIHSVLTIRIQPATLQEPIWLKDLGPCLDGGPFGFLIDGDVVPQRSKDL